MKEIDLNELAQADKMYEKAAMDLKESFKGNWDDEIHDSYRMLLNQIDDMRMNLHGMNEKAARIRNSTIGLHTDELIKTAEGLSREAESL